MNDIDKRAAMLVDALFNADQWANWSRSPARLAALLGTCEDGERALADTFIPLIDQMRSPGNAHPLPARAARSGTMPEEDDRTREEAIKAAREALDLLRIGLKEKKKADKLVAVLKAWEDTGHYKDILILKYEEGQVTEDKKKKAKEIRELLEEIQELLKQLRRKIEKDEDTDDLAEETQDKLREVLSKLILL